MGVISIIGFEPSVSLQDSHLAGKAKPRFKGDGNRPRAQSKLGST